MSWSIGDRCWLPRNATSGQVIERLVLWGQASVRVWLPEMNAVVRVAEDELEPIDAARPGVDRILYLAAAARIADALAENVLLAPMQSAVTPLPHQLYALQRATRGDRVRYLLADEVGLGKTIEAGLVIRELKLRGLVRRVLVVAPKGLTAQWQAEMRVHFHEDFRILSPSDFPAMRQVLGNFANAQDNIWRTADQVICSLDSVKPIDSRRGWKSEDVAEYNRERFDDLVSAGWDLVIIDEAHRMGGATAQVARHKLGAALSEAAPYLLLLSATPHQGKTDAFHRLMTLLDRDAFPDEASISRERVRPFVIRTEKRAAIDATGAPLFKPRQTRLTPVAWAERHYKQRTLYEAITGYVRHGYNQALKTKQRHIGFLMILMQRLVTSSTAAIRVTLERRLEVLRQSGGEQLSLFDEESWLELDGEAQVSSAIDLVGWRGEVAEVETLLEAARETEAAGTDAKAEALLELIYKLQQEEQDPDLKVLVFTEFVPTQRMLTDFLQQRGISVVELNGTMSLDQRLVAQRSFADATRILVSTDAGGEGLNLQFCHVIVNFDMPWNPMRVEQRIGRVDRIGQKHVVRAINFVLEDTVEHRVREVLEEKLEIIAHEFGVDKASDVMDSVEAEALFDDLFVKSLVEPEQMNAECDRTLQSIREQMAASKDERSLLPTTESLVADEARALMEHPLQVWLERMVVHHIRDQGGSAERGPIGWHLQWADGTEDAAAVFDVSADDPRQRVLTLEEPRLRGLASRLPQWSEGMPIPGVRIWGLPAAVTGIWSLWEVGQSSAADNRVSNKRRFLPLFVSDDGRTFLPTAKRIWDLLLTESIELTQSALTGEEAIQGFGKAQEISTLHGEKLYAEIASEQKEWLTRETDKMDYAFAARRRLIGKVGLPAVRTHRLARLDQEIAEWRRQSGLVRAATPSLTAIMMLWVGG
ncbi:MAG: helicase-related protein [Sulfuritalea sp.]|nr:helicase-related protein [Sulfuritalea sp.]